MSYRKPKIIIIGAGFAGLRALANLKSVRAEILLIDRNSYHTFVPLLYQVATGFIPPKTVAYPLSKVLDSYGNARFLTAEVLTVDFQQKLVTTDRESLTYDYLVIATGSKTKFLGVAGAFQYTYPLRTLTDAVLLRDRIFSNLKLAVTCDDKQQKQKLLTFTIVGGGATGVELAGALAESIQAAIAQKYPQLASQQIRILLIHAQNRLLADFPPHLGQYTARQLRQRGIELYLATRVSSVTREAVQLDNGELIDTATVIWTAGVAANFPNHSQEIAITKSHKIPVRSTLQLLDYPEVYGVGDVAYVQQKEAPLLGIAPEAIQQGTTVGKNLQRQIQGLAPKSFNYFNKGTAAIIARNAGVAYLFGKIPLQGFMAWLLWLGIHLYYLPGLRSRWLVCQSWLQDYFKRQRNLEPIFSRLDRTYPQPQETSSHN